MADNFASKLAHVSLDTKADINYFIEKKSDFDDKLKKQINKKVSSNTAKYVDAEN